jgi:hypothetical protein
MAVLLVPLQASAVLDTNATLRYSAPEARVGDATAATLAVATVAEAVLALAVVVVALVELRVVAVLAVTVAPV